MSDLSERLRDIQQYAINLSDEARATAGQAADEIERLNGMIETLRQLRTIDRSEIEQLKGRLLVQARGITRLGAENTRLKSLVDPLKMGTLR